MAAHNELLKYGSVSIIPFDGQRGEINVANTGVHIKVTGSTPNCTFKFAPNGLTVFSPGKQITNASRFAFGLETFARWWEDPYNRKKFGSSEIRYLRGNTNMRMLNFLLKLLGPNLIDTKPSIRGAIKVTLNFQSYLSDILISDILIREKVIRIGRRFQ